MNRDDIIKALTGALDCTRSLKSPIVHISIPTAEAILELLKEPEIIYCKDCKWNEGGSVNVMCQKDEYRSNEHLWFCGDGERKK